MGQKENFQWKQKWAGKLNENRESSMLKEEIVKWMLGMVESGKLCQSG